MDILSLNYVLIILFVIFQICDYATTIKVFNLGGGEGNKFLVWLMDKMKLDNYKMDRSISLFIIKIVVSFLSFFK